MKLIGPSYNARIVKILIAANYAGISLERDEFWPKDATEAVKQEFLKKNPNGKIPVLETEHGCLFESNTIFRYIARIAKDSKLYGTSTYEESVVDQYLDWFISSFEPVYLRVIMPIRGRWPYNKESFDKSTENLKEMLKIVEDVLKNNQYLVGNNITLADIYLIQLLNFLFRFAFDEKSRKPFPNLVKYYLKLANEKHFLNVMGRPALCKNALKPYISPEELAAAAANKKKKGGKDTEKKEEKKTEEKPEKKKQEKVAEKKTEKPEKKETKKKAEEEEEEPKAKSDKNPLDSLPPSSFNLFDFKTLIVNAPEKKEAVKTFFEQFDPSGYSIWYMSYDKAEGEGAVVFLTNNLLSGFFQRLETFRKYAFAVCGVYGDEPNLEIRGVWVWRGTEMPNELKDHPQIEYFNFTKLDSKNENDRKKLEEYWCGMNEDEDVVDGLKARTVRFYK